jgi:hypothetical protein
MIGNLHQLPSGYRSSALLNRFGFNLSVIALDKILSSAGHALGVFFPEERHHEHGASQACP